jgi:hypothetical protein
MPARIALHPSGHYLYILHTDRDEVPLAESAAPARAAAADLAPLQQKNKKNKGEVQEAATATRVDILHLMSARFKGAFAMPQGTRLIAGLVRVTERGRRFS